LAPLQGWPLIELDEWPLRRKLGGGADRLEMVAGIQAIHPSGS